MIFNQRIKREYDHFSNYDVDYEAFRRALSLTRIGEGIGIKYGDKLFMSLPESEFKQMSDHQQMALGLGVNSGGFLKFAVYAHLHEVGKLKDYFDYAKSHGYVVRDARCSYI
jgi:hypothetical protein